MERLKKGIVMFMMATALLSAAGCAGGAETASASSGEPAGSSDSRFLDVEIGNARQLGGYIGADGKRVKDNVLLRTAGLDGISGETAEKLAEEYRVKQIVDFRMDYERNGAADKEVPGAENTWISVYKLDMADPAIAGMMEKIREAGDDSLQKSIEYAKTGYLSSLYTEILLSEEGRKGYAQFFDILLDNTDGAVLWHCTYGKDRTGLAAALVLYALGVDEDTIMQDFLISNEVYQDEIAGLEDELRRRGCEDAVIKEAQAMAGVKGEYLSAAFDAVKSEYGSVENYIEHQLGVSSGDLAKLRNMYLA